MAQQENRFTIEALVIKEMKIGESDRLVTLLSAKHGVVKAFASGAKNIKSKKASATSLLTYGSFTVKNKNGSLRIYEATPINVFFGAGSDIEVLALSQYFCELSYEFAVSDDQNTELLRLILNSLHFLTAKKRNSSLIKAITELRIAVLSGYAPDLVACTECGKFEDNIMYFSLEDGSIYCSECKPQSRVIPIDRTLVEAMRHIVYSKFEKLYAFTIPDERAKQLAEITGEYITRQTDHRFHTLDFYNSIKEQ